MLKVHKIALKNIVTYQDEEFLFKEGLSLVRGENRAGKSLLFSSVANLLYFSHPLSDKKDVKTLHASRDDKKDTSSIELELASAHNNYNIVQKSVKDSVVYQIQENGIDLDSRTISLSKQVVESIFSQPEDIFFTSTYLTSYRNHPLHQGSTSQRYDFFEKLFNFDLLDYCYDKFNLTLKELDIKEQELKSLLSNAADLTLKEEELLAALTELDNLQTRRDVIQAALSELTQVRIEVIRLQDIDADLAKTKKAYEEFLVTNSIHLSAYKVSQLNSDSITQLEKDYQEVLETEKGQLLLDSKKMDLQQFSAQLTSLQVKEAGLLKDHPDLAERDLGALNAQLRKVQEISSANLGILQGKDLDQWKVVYGKMDTLLNTIAQELSINKETLTQLNKISVEKKLESLQQDHAKHSFAVSDVSIKLNKIRTLNNNIEGLHQEGEKVKCPTCLSNLNHEQLHEYKLQLENDYNEAEKNQQVSASLKDAYSKYSKYLAYVETIPTLSSLEEAWNLVNCNKGLTEVLLILVKIISDKEVINNQIATTKAEVDILTNKSFTLITKTSAELKLVIDATKDSLRLKERVESLETNLNNKLLSLKDLVLKLSLKDKINIGEALTTSDLKNFRDILEQQIANATSENVGMQAAITSNSVTSSLLKREIESLKKQKERIDTLQEECKKSSLIKKLVEVFHPKGFRLEKINQFTKVFEQTLNKYSGFLFMENFSFQIVVEKRDLQILATRNGKTSDVRYLSGSESRCFQLLCLITILSLLPTSKRANICILDEMDAGCDEGTTKMYYEKFLPELKNIVPSITVITPLGDTGLYINQDRSYMVRKTNGISTIEEITN